MFFLIILLRFNLLESVKVNTEKRRGRPATGIKTATVRVPIELKPTVEKLVKLFKAEKKAKPPPSSNDKP